VAGEHHSFPLQVVGNLAVSQIVTNTMENLGMKLPKPTLDLELIRVE